MNEHSVASIAGAGAGFFDRPVVRAIGWLCSIVGLLLTIYFYYAAIQKPQLTYHVCPLRQLDRGAGVTTARIMLWNAGNRAIESSDVLSEDGVGIGVGALLPPEILEAGVIEQSRREIQPKLSIDNRGVRLDWRILEENDGFVILVSYRGDEKVLIHAWGTLKGQPRLKSIGYPINVGQVEAPNFYEELWPPLLAALATVIIVAFLLRKRSGVLRSMAVGLVATMVAYAVIHWLSAPALPFDC